MLRSLFSGISGLKNHQIGIDVIGTNLANVNTTGYKGSRITFKDIISQTMKVAAAPNADTGVGGINPLQVGLGSSVSSIDSIMTQGNLQTTNNFTDLALQGEGFFALSDGRRTFYTRAGTFAFDKDGFLVSTANALKVQGYNASNGVMGTTVEGIQVPKGVILPARATTGFDMYGNLDAAAEQIGTILNTKVLVARDNGTTDINGLYAGAAAAGGNLNDFITGMTAGQSTVTVNIGGVQNVYTYNTGALGAGEFNTLANLQGLITADYGASVTATINAAGALNIQNTTAGNLAVSMTSTNTLFNTAMSGLTATYAAGASNQSDEFSHRALETDLLTNVRVGEGANRGSNLGLAAGDIIALSANIGSSTTPTTANYTVAAGSTLANLCDTVSTTFSLTNPDNTEVNSTGQFVVTGDGGTAFAISNLDITATSGGLPVTDFNGVFRGSGTNNWTQVQAAQDNYRSEIIIYDENGTAHTMTIAENIRGSSGGLIQWVWTATCVDSQTGTADALSPTSGTITFNSDGSLSAFSPATITITPSGVANPFTVQINPGTINGHDGLVCFDGNSTAAIRNQDGYAAGELDSLQIDQTGLVIGTFTNGRNLDLAQLVLAKFDNPSGLERKGDNMWTETRNSGLPNLGQPGAGGRALVLTSTLEMSNVDLSTEFTNMIVMERGFQANASTIQTSDQILQELVRLKR